MNVGNLKRTLSRFLKILQKESKFFNRFLSFFSPLQPHFFLNLPVLLLSLFVMILSVLNLQRFDENAGDIPMKFIILLKNIHSTCIIFIVLGKRFDFALSDYLLSEVSNKLIVCSLLDSTRDLLCVVVVLTGRIF